MRASVDLPQPTRRRCPARRRPAARTTRRRPRAPRGPAPACRRGCGTCAARRAPRPRGVMPPRRASSRTAGGRGSRARHRRAGAARRARIRRIAWAQRSRKPQPAKSGRDARHHAGDAAERLVAAHAARHRDAAQQAACIGMRGRGEQRSAVGASPPPRRHTSPTTRSAMRATMPRSWVISSRARPSSRCSVCQQPQDLRLHGDVERGGRLVGDQQFGLAHQRHRDHHALAQAAGKLVRILPEPHARRGDADAAEQLGGAVERRARACRRDGGAAPRPSASRSCRPGSGWSSAPGRSSPCRSPRSRAMPRSAAASGRGRGSAAHRRVRRRAAREQAHDGERGDRLAAAGFADQAMGLAAVHVSDTPRTAAMWCRRRRAGSRFEDGVIERVCPSPRLEDRRTWRRGCTEHLAPRSRHRARPVPSRSRSPSPSRLMPEHQHEQRHAGDHDHPGREEHVVLALGDHQAPGRQRRRHAEARGTTAPPPAGSPAPSPASPPPPGACRMFGSTSRSTMCTRERAGGLRGGDVVEVAHLHRGRARHHGEALPQQQAQRQDHHVSELPTSATTAAPPGSAGSTAGR